jgi:hypothetical protein
MPGTMIYSGADVLAYITTEGLYCGQLQSALVSTSLDSELENEEEAVSSFEELYKVYPNPTYGPFTLELLNIDEAQDYYIEILNTMGTMILKMKLEGATHHTFDFSDQSTGIYFIRLIRGEQAGIKKLIINR